MAKIVCPYCFEEFNRSEVMFRCTNDECKKKNDEAMKKFWGKDRIMPPAFDNGLGKFAKMMDKMPDSAKCPECGHTSYTVICPHCHNMIPKEMVEHKGYIISIIGARSSGKTNYITVLIDQLRKNGGKIGQNLGVLASTVADNNEDCTQYRYQENFYKVLFKNGELPAQTKIDDAQSKIPLIFTVTQAGVKKPLYLVFYDTAGENFNELKNISKNVKFLNESDAVIFLLDTFSIKYVHDKLGIKDEIELNYDVILNNIDSHFRNNVSKAVKEAHFNTPMAFAFSKIDAILQNADVFADTAIPGMSLDQNSPYLSGGGVRMDDIDAVSDGIRSALLMWGQDNFINLTMNYKNAKYFGFSALGKNPDAQNTIKGITPYRVLDPLVWILDQLGYPILKSK